MYVKEKLETFINNITLDFTSETHYISDYVDIEKLRKKLIRASIMATVKLYKGYNLDSKEKELLDDYPLIDNYNNEPYKAVVDIVYRINDDMLKEVNDIRLKKYGEYHKYKRDNYMREIVYESYIRYVDYYDSLDEYVTSLRHARSYNHEVSLINPKDRNKITASLDFDKNLFDEPNFVKEDNKNRSLLKLIFRIKH